jgi:hypothetical protein
LADQRLYRFFLYQQTPGLLLLQFSENGIVFYSAFHALHAFLYGIICQASNRGEFPAITFTSTVIVMASTP